MAQKILSARASDPSLAGSSLDAQVEQIVLSRSPRRVLDEAPAQTARRLHAEIAIAYDGRCVTDAGESATTRASLAEMSSRGLLVARPGGGFPAPVHLERFASPARLCVTDDPRLSAVGGLGMLSLVLSSRALAETLACGVATLAAPVSIQVLLSGRLRPFVCARDVSLELLRRELAAVVRRATQGRGAPVVLEFSGPSVRMLSVGERSVIAAIAPQVGAAASLFVSDERTEVFLRDQRRSKAHRALAPDPGASFEQVVSVDLGAVDPLVQDEEGQVRAVRDLVGLPVTQAFLGGDSGATLRDLFAAAALLKSKRVPSTLDFLLALPSRQMLEVLATAGALTDLIATGARLVEPDARVLTGELYAITGSGASVRTFDSEPRLGGGPRALVVSAETLAYAVANGELGDPRSFKRPVRITVPRALPTDDVLVARKLPRTAAETRAHASTAPARGSMAPSLQESLLLQVRPASQLGADAPRQSNGAVAGGDARAPLAVVCFTLDELRAVSARAFDLAPGVRAVIADHWPSPHAALMAAAGIAALRALEQDMPAWREVARLELPGPASAHPDAVGAGTLRLTRMAALHDASGGAPHLRSRAAAGSEGAARKPRRNEAQAKGRRRPADEA